MSGAALRTSGALLCAGVAVGAVVAPSLVVGADAAAGGAASRADLDLVLASAAVGGAYAAWLCRVLRRGRGARGREADLWLSAVHALVVLLLLASTLPAAVLHLTAELHAGLVDAEWPVLLAWSAVMGVAVLLAEGARRLSLRWLQRP